MFALGHCKTKGTRRDQGGAIGHVRVPEDMLVHTTQKLAYKQAQAHGHKAHFVRADNVTKAPAICMLMRS
jgi:hypothetical protein